MNSKQERLNKWQPRGGCNNSLVPLFIEGYFYFLNYPYLHRVYPLHLMDQLIGFLSDSHALHTKLFRLDAPFAVMSCAASDSHWNRHNQVLRPNLSKTGHP
jgi:hypothetical protein